MYFKKLEIVGFKSFLNKTKLSFEPGVTAIVGPNGCGKSNIVDAIKWVFGEQAPSAMRSTCMQDVIFNGTEKQEPVNLAEVSITFSNEDRTFPVDYDELIITRRLFRDGESEYLMNKNPMRLTDIKRLLMGTGLGTSSYSVIEQGKMDMIISSKPEERRFIFEEASGITKFKSQKREAVLKLERTQENLTRINDIVHEVERQIRSIELKARKAERYRAVYDELKNLEISVARDNLKSLSSGTEGLSGEVDKLRSALSSLGEKLASRAGGLSDSKAKYGTLTERIQNADRRVMKLSSEIDKARHTITINKERVEELNRYVQKLDIKIEESTEREESLNISIKELNEKFNRVMDECGNREEELKTADSRVAGFSASIEKNKIELKTGRDTLVNILSEESRVKNDLIKQESDTQNVILRERRLNVEKNNVEEEKKRVSEELETISRVFETVKNELEEAGVSFDDFARRFAREEERLSAIKGERNSKEKRLNEIRPNINFLKRVIAEREGINDGSKAVMKLVEEKDERAKGVFGILSEIIGVREGYEESFEVFLGHLSQAIVVDKRETAERIRGFLEEKKFGGVSFIIIDELIKRAASANGAYISKGTLDDITHVMNAREPYSSALKNMLKDVFVTVSSETADVFIKDTDFENCILCEDGEIFKKGLYRTKNYSAKETLSVFGRKEKLDELLKEEETVLRDITKLEASLRDLEAWLNGKAAEKSCLEKRLNEKRMECADKSSKKAAVKEKSDLIEDELLLLESELDEERELVERSRMEGERLSLKLKGFDSEKNALDSRIEFLQNEIQEYTAERERTLFKISDIKSELSGLRKEVEHVGENLKRDKELLGRLTSEVEQSRINITENARRIKALEEESVRSDDRINEYSLIKDFFIFKNNERNEDRSVIADEMARMEKEKSFIEDEIEKSKNAIRDIEVKEREYGYRKESIAQRLMDTYKVNILDEGVQTVEIENKEEAAAKINELKDKIDKMGEVSLGAEKEHKELEERYAFLTRQRDDLVKGREDVLEAIRKINRTTKTMFLETFEAIKKEFSVYFKMLFTGGRAELILQDENDILECGIDIVVRPPGKKLQNIMLLSGGEKAMTAIALIFAIFKVNPSPFCILDEIDAPLDESNIVRFCRVLSEFLKLSQFIIVTHNRMTIQLADILYGITMEEKGVSKIVSVKFGSEKEMKESVPIPQAV